MVGLSKYPNSIDSDKELAHLIDRSSYVVAKDLNAIRDAIFSIEQTLGTMPQGSFLTLGERFANMDEVFLPLTGGNMVGNLNLQDDVANVSARTLLGDSQVGFIFDELSKNELTDVDLGTKWLPSEFELQGNADPDGTPPFSIIGKNTADTPNASGSMVASGRRKVRMFDDVQIAGNAYIKDFISTPRVATSKNVVTGSLPKPVGPNAASVKTLVSGNLDVLGNFSGDYGMTYLGGVLLERWWSDPDFIASKKVLEVGLMVPTDQPSQPDWNNLLIMFSGEFHEENIAIQLMINNRIVSGPILYSKLSKNRSMMNFVVLNKDNLDSIFGWTNSNQSQSYLEHLDGTIRSDVSDIRMQGRNFFNDPSNNIDKFWSNSLGVSNCHGKDILEYVDTSNKGNNVIRISLVLAKHDIHRGSLYQTSPSFAPNAETNISGDGVTEASSPNVKNLQIFAIALNDSEIESSEYELSTTAFINRPDMAAVYDAVTNPAINPDRVEAH